MHVGDILSAEIPPLSPSDGEVYFNSRTNSIQMWNGLSWIPASLFTTIVSDGEPAPEDVSGPGQFWFRPNLNELHIWTDNGWVEVETKNSGLPTYEKPGIGTDETSEEREELINQLKLLFGWPVQCIELNEDHFNAAIRNALEEFRHRADNAYTNEYILLRLDPGKQTYFLNDPTSGTNRIVEILRIHRLQNYGLNGMLGNSEINIYAQEYVNALLRGSNFDSVTLFLNSALMETISLMVAGEYQFSWKEPQRILQVFKRVSSPEVVMINAASERTEQDILLDRNVAQWIQDWARGELYEMLGNIRSKFNNLPGPNGGISLNGSECFSRADTIFQDCLRQIQDMEIGNGVSFGNSQFLMG